MCARKLSMDVCMMTSSVSPGSLYLKWFNSGSGHVRRHTWLIKINIDDQFKLFLCGVWKVVMMADAISLTESVPACNLIIVVRDGNVTIKFVDSCCSNNSVGHRCCYEECPMSEWYVGSKQYWLPWAHKHPAGEQAPWMFCEEWFEVGRRTAWRLLCLSHQFEKNKLEKTWGNTVTSCHQVRL